MKKVLVVRHNGQLIEADQGWDLHHQNLRDVGQSTAIDKTQSIQYLVVEKDEELLIQPTSDAIRQSTVRHLIRPPKRT